MGVEFFSDFIKSIQPLQAQMAIILYQEFKHQAQLNTVRAPQNKKTKAHLENRGKGKKKAWNKSCSAQLPTPFSWCFNGPKSYNKLSSWNYFTVIVNGDFSYDFSQQPSNQSFILKLESCLWYLFNFWEGEGYG